MIIINNACSKHLNEFWFGELFATNLWENWRSMNKLAQRCPPQMILLRYYTKPDRLWRRSWEAHTLKTVLIITIWTDREKWPKGGRRVQFPNEVPAMLGFEDRPRTMSNLRPHRLIPNMFTLDEQNNYCFSKPRTNNLFRAQHFIMKTTDCAMALNLVTTTVPFDPETAAAGNLISNIK